jgi:hypothetical protein
VKSLTLQHFPDCSCTQNLDHPSYARPGIHPFPGRLYVVTMLENPLRWRSRYLNYWAFEHHVEASGGILYTAEIAFGERHFEVTEAGNPRHLQLRTEAEPWNYELWHKEGALNLLIQRLPAEAMYIGWIDCDVQFARPDWCQETLHLLQHYQVLQMFSHTQDLGPDGELLGRSEGFVSKYHELAKSTGGAARRPYPYYYYYGRQGLWIHPGFAWAVRRDALNHLGGLVDWAILGSGDWLMASALFGDVDRALNPGFHQNYRELAHIWQDRAEKHIRRNVGHLPGLVLHRWHGRKADRQYDRRWELLVKTQFDPINDLKRDVQGLYALSDPSMALREGIRKYAHSRNEDASEL